MEPPASATHAGNTCNVQVMRTRDAFQRFFSGMEREKVERLLHEAYADLDAEAARVKIEKRMGLLDRKGR